MEIDEHARVSTYVFGTNTADFMVCSICGVVPLVSSRIDDRMYAVVNVNTLEDVGRFSFSSSVSNFDDEDTAGRLERRRRNWIPDVLISAASG